MKWCRIAQEKRGQAKREERGKLTREREEDE
jgi:hypothetical protein